MSQPWPDLYSEQAAYINTLEQRLNRLHRKSVPATVVNTSRPTVAEMAAAWSLKEGKTINVPAYGKTQWYNPETDQLENLFVSLPQYSTQPFGVQADELALPTTEIIGRYVRQEGDAVATSFTASWTKTYRAIWFYWSVRSTVAAISATWQIRVNGSIGAIYSHAASKIDQTPQATFDAAYLAANGWQVGAIPGATAPNSILQGQGQGIIYFPDVTAVGKSGFFDALHLTNDASGATELRYNTGGWHANTLSAITSLVFVPQSGFAVGSKVVVMGLHPQS